MGKIPQPDLAKKCKRSANAQKCRFRCVKSETTACLGDDIGQKKQGPQIERKGLFFGLCNGHHRPTGRRMGAQKSPVRPKPNGATQPQNQPKRAPRAAVNRPPRATQRKSAVVTRSPFFIAGPPRYICALSNYRGATQAEQRGIPRWVRSRELENNGPQVLRGSHRNTPPFLNNPAPEARAMQFPNLCGSCGGPLH